MVIAGLLTLVAACGTSSGGDDTVTSAGGGNVLAAAYQATNGAHTARVQIRTTLSASSPGSSLNSASTADGVLDFAKDSRDLTTNQPVGGQSETRLVDGVDYIRLPTAVSSRPGAKAWLKVTVPAGLQVAGSATDPTQLLSLLRGSADAIAKVGADTVRGVRTTHYKAQIDLTKLVSSSAASPAPGAPDGVALLEKVLGSKILPMDIWVDGQQRIVRLQTVTPLTAFAGTTGTSTSPAPGTTPSPLSSRSSTGTTTSIEEFYDFGVPVDVQAPPADQVEVAPTPTLRAAPPMVPMVPTVPPVPTASTPS